MLGFTNQREVFCLSNSYSIASVDILPCPRDEAARTLLNLFFRVHFIVGMKVNDTLRTFDTLNRHQVAVLWTIRSEGINGRSMRRKYIENVMTGWYDISSSAISKAIRAISKPPLGLITIEEHPQSAREKLVSLTPRGEEFVHAMVQNGSSMCAWFLGNMERWEGEPDVSLYIYSKINALFSELIDAERRERGELMQESVTPDAFLQHPLASQFLDRNYGWSEVPHIPREYAPLMHLNIFFPIHYKAGNRVEQALRSAASLNRQQVIILWTIAAQGIDGEHMSRKMIERTLQNWLEITSSSVSKALRSLMDKPLNLLTITEHPDSGREKIVRLTRNGKATIEEMLANGEHFLQQVIDQLSQEEIDMVVYIFKRTHEIFKKYPGPFRDREPFNMIK